MHIIASITVQSLVALLDQFTPSIFNVIPTVKEKRNFRKLCLLVTKIIEVGNKSFTQKGCALLVDALLFGAEKHKGGRRYDETTPYFIHCLEVLNFLIQMGVRDLEVFIAAIIHDTMEDCGATKKELTSRFGENVYLIVKVLSKHPDKIMELFYWYNMRNEPNAYIRLKAITIKFPDRAHSLRTLKGLPKARRLRIKEETKKEFPELLEVFIDTFSELSEVEKNGLPANLAESLHDLVLKRLL